MSGKSGAGSAATQGATHCLATMSWAWAEVGRGASVSVHALRAGGERGTGSVGQRRTSRILGVMASWKRNCAACMRCGSRARRRGVRERSLKAGAATLGPARQARPARAGRGRTMTGVHLTGGSFPLAWSFPPLMTIERST